MYESSRIFKGLFFALVVVVTLLILGVSVLIIYSSDMLASPDDQMAFVLLTSALIFSYVILGMIGVVVFRGAANPLTVFGKSAPIAAMH